MITSDVQLDARDDRGRTALLAAIHANRIKAARLLIGAGPMYTWPVVSISRRMQHA